jgi:beta-glucanase (GH16 family)
MGDALFAVLLRLFFFGEPAGIPKGYDLVWADEFNNTKLDRSRWNYRGLGPRGDANIVESAVTLNGKGNLVISLSRLGDELYSGMIATNGLFETKYGYFETRAKLPEISGAWPAFWLQSATNVEGGQPETHGVEIDIFEYFPHETKGAVSHSLHWGGYGRSHHHYGPFYSKLQPTLDGFHVFGLEWTPRSYSTFVDGVKTFTGDAYISQVKQFLILSLEADRKIAGELDQQSLPGKFEIDYVRVYKKRN